MYTDWLIEQDKQMSFEQKIEAQKLENGRRKHNYIPFIFELLKLGVEENLLEQFYEEAVQK